ncbi:2-aminoethylphosphonate--pyruvate transaminase [Staphylococcus debuckii]|uniref:2-aminoethylphosphonate--pyruvate transaminase n=1 Tax=Staphylococcus debuckii TaxID=2044912 RepID=A0ABU9EWA6_9STAP
MTQKYKLLTPGPLTTTDTVKQKMLEDRCTWDSDYKQLTQDIRHRLLKVAEVSEGNYTAVLQQGSGSFVVESVLQTVLGKDDHVLIISNGAYGNRMIDMAKAIGKRVTEMRIPYNTVPDFEKVEALIKQDQSLTHIAMVHCETTTGILNPLEPLSEIGKRHNVSLIIDAMSSFGGIPMNVEKLNIDYLISSANKCIQGVPGFGFVVAKQSKLEQTKGNANSIALDLFEQWKVMDRDGKWRFTSPTHVVAAFQEALIELEEEGGVATRYQRYSENNHYIIESLKKMNFQAYIDAEHQSPIITTFLYPDKDFDFEDFYQYMKEAGFVLYPGKLMDTPSFRVGNIGDLHHKDFVLLADNIQKYMKERN